MEQKLNQTTIVNLTLEKDLKVAQVHMTKLWVDLKKRRKKLHSVELLIRDNLCNLKEVEAQKAKLERKVATLEQRVESANQKVKLAI